MLSRQLKQEELVWTLGLIVSMIRGPYSIRAAIGLQSRRIESTLFRLFYLVSDLLW